MTKSLLTTIFTEIIIAILLVPSSMCYIVWRNINNIALQLEPIPKVTVYFDKLLDENSVCNIITQLQVFENIVYMNRFFYEKNIKDFTGCFNLDGILNKNVNNFNTYTFTFSPKINFKNFNDLLHDKLIKIKGIKKVVINESLSFRLIKIKQLVIKITLIISILMFISLILVINYDIKLRIFENYNNIKIMKLIGATDWFITQPFLNNMVIISITGAIISLIITYISVLKLSDAIIKITNFFSTQFHIKNLLFEESLFVILLSVIIGCLVVLIKTNIYLNNLKIK